MLVSSGWTINSVELLWWDLIGTPDFSLNTVRGDIWTLDFGFTNNLQEKAILASSYSQKNYGEACRVIDRVLKIGLISGGSLAFVLFLGPFVGFSDIEVVEITKAQSFGIKAKKPTWKIGSWFSLKKLLKSLPKVQIVDDMDHIDKDSLLSEEDLKRPQLPPVGDCEVGSTRKACKNCSCGCAEEEEKVQKLGVTMDQLENPKSFCGSTNYFDSWIGRNTRFTIFNNFNNIKCLKNFEKTTTHLGKKEMEHLEQVTRMIREGVH
ncbi:unnamed protein product [Lactuca saligna]|uniref:Uncharacterized protein n=1 Tax=Lactuca saligna TaxID=75948 RepID=A0AA35VN70_LACSI|nr:unnamed protein product [Lactuca saligna]